MGTKPSVITKEAAAFDVTKLLASLSHAIKGLTKDPASLSKAVAVVLAVLLTLLLLSGGGSAAPVAETPSGTQGLSSPDAGSTRYAPCDLDDEVQELSTEDVDKLRAFLRSLKGSFEVEVGIEPRTTVFLFANEANELTAVLPDEDRSKAIHERFPLLLITSAKMVCDKKDKLQNKLLIDFTGGLKCLITHKEESRLKEIAYGFKRMVLSAAPNQEKGKSLATLLKALEQEGSPLKGLVEGLNFLGGAIAQPAVSLFSVFDQKTPHPEVVSEEKEEKK
jgi:hypothetical protein